MRLFHSLKALLTEPPPAMAFEISEAGIALARIGQAAEFDFEPLKAGTVSISPLRDNVLAPDDLALTVRKLAPSNGNRKRRDAALILPDYCTRVTVLDFDDFPSDPKERLSLVRFRLKKTVPFDIESAAVSYWPQTVEGKKHDVVAVVAPIEIVARYEAPFRAVGLNPGLVTVSSLAALNLVSGPSVTVVAKLSGRVLTVLVLEKERLRLVRCLELTDQTVAEVAADLYPTFVFIEDNLGSRAERLLLCGFGPRTEEARAQFTRELDVEVEPVRSLLSTPGENDAGLIGYVQSLGVSRKEMAALQ